MFKAFKLFKGRQHSNAAIYMQINYLSIHYQLQLFHMAGKGRYNNFTVF